MQESDRLGAGAGGVEEKRRQASVHMLNSACASSEDWHLAWKLLGMVLPFLGPLHMLGDRITLLWPLFSKKTRCCAPPLSGLILFVTECFRAQRCQRYESNGQKVQNCMLPPYVMILEEYRATFFFFFNKQLENIRTFMLLTTACFYSAPDFKLLDRED